MPVLAAVVAAHGHAGLALASMRAGVILLIMGGLKRGGLLKFIPYPVIAGFTTGIAVIIFTAQLNEGLDLGLKMPEHMLQQGLALATHLPAVQWHTVATLLLSFGILYGLPRVSRAGLDVGGLRSSLGSLSESISSASEDNWNNLVSSGKNHISGMRGALSIRERKL